MVSAVSIDNLNAKTVNDDTGGVETSEFLEQQVSAVQTMVTCAMAI